VAYLPQAGAVEVQKLEKCNYATAVESGVFSNYLNQNPSY
jgi:hypothetical protein